MNCMSERFNYSLIKTVETYFASELMSHFGQMNEKNMSPPIGSLAVLVSYAVSAS